MNSYQIILLIVVVIIITLLLVYRRNLVNFDNRTIGDFQQITILLALIILVCILVFIGVCLAYASKNDTLSQDLPQCPDFWEIEATAKGSRCVNVQNLGTCPAASGDPHLSLDFSGGNFTDNCAKYTWANNCNVAWDGLTYGAENPCTVAAAAAATLSASAAAAAEASKAKAEATAEAKAKAAAVVPH